MKSIALADRGDAKATISHKIRGRRRIPSEGSPDVATHRIEERIAELDAKIFQSLARRREASVEAGRALNELKRILGRGKWQRHFAEMFVPTGLTLRTAERYMKRAKKADAVSNIDKLSIFKSATDQGARGIREANQQAQAEVGALSAKNNLEESLRPYSLRLRMTAKERDAMDAMLKLSDWPHVEKKIVRLLRRCWAKYGIVKKDTRRRS